MRSVRNSAFGVGIATGIAAYVFIRFSQQMMQPLLALELLAALGVGLGLSICYYLFCKRVLRRVASQVRAAAAPLLGAALPPIHADELEELRQIYAAQMAIAVRHAQLADAARDAQNMLAALYQVSHDLGDNQDVDAVLRRALASAAALTTSSHATILLLDDTGEQITHRIALERDNVAPLGMVAGPMMRQGLAGWVARARRAALIRDTEQDARWLPGPGLGDMRSALAVPLLEGDRPLGVITLAHDLPDHYTEDHLRLLEALGTQAALAIRNARRSETTPTYVLAPASVSAAEPLRPAASAPAGNMAYEPPGTQEVVALFADMRGFTSASERLAPEVLVNDVLDVYIQTMTETLQRFDGQLDQRSGDGILAIFGHPASRPDDALRAVRAALAMRQAATRLRARWRARLGVDLGLAVGISRGRVAVGRIGLPGRSDYTVIGDAVNLAGRLQGLARAGEILAAGEVIESLSGAGFDVEALPPLPLDQQDGLQQIFRVGDPVVRTRQPVNPNN